MGSYVGIDLHRRRSVIVVMDEAGETLSTSRIDNDPCTLAAAVAAAGPEAEVAVEATWGWYWAAEVIAEAGGRMHLAHPLGIKGFDNRRVKNDVVDATLLGGSVADGTGSRDNLCSIARHEDSELQVARFGQAPPLS